MPALSCCAKSPTCPRRSTRPGRISQQDVLKPVVELSKLHGDLLMFEEQAGIAAARLNVLLARAPEAPIGPLTEPTEQTLLPAPTDLQRLALDHQPELQRAHLEIERAEAELASAKREYKPDFTVQGGYLLMPNQTDAWLARVGVTWPSAPWSRDKISAHITEQIAASEAAKARERAMQNMVRLAVQEAYVRAKSAQDRAALLRTTILPQAQQTLDVSRIAYQTDRLDFQAVIDNQRTLLDAQLAYVRALSEFEQATADLERAVGADLPEGTTTSVTRERRGSAMKRALLFFLAVGVLLLAVGAGVYVFRMRAQDHRIGSAERSRGDADHARWYSNRDGRASDDSSWRRDDRSTSPAIDRREDRSGDATNGRSDRTRGRCRSVRRDQAGRRECEDRGLDS